MTAEDSKCDDATLNGNVDCPTGEGAIVYPDSCTCKSEDQTECVELLHLCDHGESKYNTKRLYVDVADINDKAPAFESPEVAYIIMANAPAKQKVGDIFNVIDLDSTADNHWMS